MIEVLRKELNVVTKTSYTDEVNFKSTIENIEAETANILDHKKAQALENGNIVANLQREIINANDNMANQIRYQYQHSLNRSDAGNRYQREVQYLRAST